LYIFNCIVSRWAGRTHRWFEQLWKAGLSSITGVTLVPVTRVSSGHECSVQPEWRKLVYGFHEISGENLQRLNEQHGTSYKYVAVKSRIGYFDVNRLLFILTAALAAALRSSSRRFQAGLSFCNLHRRADVAAALAHEKARGSGWKAEEKEG